MKEKLCFCLLNYQKDTHRHYYHIYEFIEALGERVDLRLLVMDAEGEPEFRSPGDVLNLTGNGIGIRWKRALALISAHRAGYRVFYHHYTTAPARFTAFLTRLFGGKTFLWHCIVMDGLDKILPGSRPVKYLKKLMLKTTLHLIHNLVTGTEFMADYYADRYGIHKSKIKVIPNYINLSRFNRSGLDTTEIKREIGVPPDRKVVLYLHELEEGRAGNLGAVIEAVLMQRPETFFLVAGDGRYRGQLERRVKKFVENGQVMFVGSVPNIEAPRYYAIADVYVMTSGFEAFSRVLLEAMAMGTPYVATDGGGNIRVYTPQEHQDFIIANDQIDLFPQKVIQLLDEPETARKCISAGLEHVRRFSLEHVLQSFIDTVFSK